jgi:hypothetical protein
MVLLAVFLPAELGGSGEHGGFHGDDVLASVERGGRRRGGARRCGLPAGAGCGGTEQGILLGSPRTLIGT